MQIEHFKVQNVKCGGCASNIQNGLAELNGVDKVEVNIESGEVDISGEKLDRQQLTEMLSRLGYPEV
ncbi:MAG: heavy-metal-associated domain-containing protein [Gammaproteobacteria bacterium]|nr:heavy-metal-associated domain-containing protein [Gammaproteobacteria bacterium]